MKALSYFNQTAQQVSTHRCGVVKIEAQANPSATTGLYFQVHDSVTTPANGVAPLKCWPLEEMGYKEFELHELRVATGLYVCLSTTYATKTLATGGNDNMLTLQVELQEAAKPETVETAGDFTTTTRASLDVWTDDPTDVHRLHFVRVKFTGYAGYLHLFARPDQLSKPVATFGPAELTDEGYVLRLHFGEHGRKVFQSGGVTAYRAGGLEHTYAAPANACTLRPSQTVENAFDEGNYMTCYAEYV